ESRTKLALGRRRRCWPCIRPMIASVHEPHAAVHVEADARGAEGGGRAAVLGAFVDGGPGEGSAEAAAAVSVQGGDAVDGGHAVDADGHGAGDIPAVADAGELGYVGIGE